MTRRSRTSERPAHHEEIPPEASPAAAEPPAARLLGFDVTPAVPTELRWNGQPLRVHASRELAQTDRDDCLKRRHRDVTRALGAGHEHHAAHVGEFTLHDAPPPPPPDAPAIVDDAPAEPTPPALDDQVNG